MAFTEHNPTEHSCESMIAGSISIALLTLLIFIIQRMMA